MILYILLKFALQQLIDFTKKEMCICILNIFQLPIATIYQESCIKIVRFLIQQITFYWHLLKKKLKKLETKNVRKQLNTIRKISYIYIYIYLKLHQKPILRNSCFSLIFFSRPFWKLLQNVYLYPPSTLDILNRFTFLSEKMRLKKI